MQTVTWKQLNQSERAALLKRPAQTDTQFASEVEKIINLVREGGDDAVRALTRKFDGVELERLRVDRSAFNQAYAEVSDAEMSAIQAAIKRVRAFHTKQMPLDLDMETDPGVRCWRTMLPIERVGLYVPGGTAPLISTVIMLAVPASVANCPTRILCTPPDSAGGVDPRILVAADQCGLSEVFAIGGAQAIAAMAYGTQSVPKVDKIFGPGNGWVTAAKLAVAMDPEGAALDLPAGPSEAMVVVDATSQAAFAAADLLSQAEHDPNSQVLLVSLCPRQSEAVVDQINRQLSTLTRREIARAALASARIINVETDEEAAAVVNAYAPEHLLLQQQNARTFLPRVRNAGSVFIGSWTPEAVGDYASGTNHVLPTYGYARSYSGLGTEAYMKSMTVQELSVEGLSLIGKGVETLAAMEGLDGHKRAVSIRLQQISERSI